MSDIQSGPQSTVSFRVLRVVVIVLGALIVIALAILVAGLVGRFAGSSPRSGESSAPTIHLPKDARILEMQVQTNRLIVRFRTGGGDEIDIFDIANGRLVARIRSGQ